MKEELSNETLKIIDDVILPKLPKESVDEISSKETWYGWLIVSMTFLVTFTLFGLLYSTGILLNYYKSQGIGDTTELSFIATTNAAVSGMGSLISGRIDLKIKHRRCILLGTIIYSLGLLLSSWAIQTWQLLLSQGLMMGMGSSLIFMASFTAVIQWFDKRRSLACGITLSGSGVGGLVLAPTLQFLIQKLGVPWTLRLFSLMTFIILSTVGIVVKEPHHTPPQTVFTFKFSLLKDKKLILLLISVATFAFGFLVPLFTMQSYAIDHGIDPSKAAFIIGVINGSSAIGRIITGCLADRLGNINMISLTMILTSVSCLFVWSFATTFTTLILFGIIYGLVSSGFASLPAVISVQLFGIQRVSQVTSFIFVVMGIPNLLGTPLANYILKLITSNHTNYLPLILFSGTTALLGFIFIMFLKLSVKPSNQFFTKI